MCVCVCGGGGGGGGGCMQFSLGTFFTSFSKKNTHSQKLIVASKKYGKRREREGGFWDEVRMMSCKKNSLLC